MTHALGQSNRCVPFGQSGRLSVVKSGRKNVLRHVLALAFTHKANITIYLWEARRITLCHFPHLPHQTYDRFDQLLLHSDHITHFLVVLTVQYNKTMADKPAFY